MLQRAAKWRFDPGIQGTQPARGLTYWTDGKQGRLFAGIMEYLYCLDADTGKPIASFGEGRIDLRKDLRGDYKLSPSPSRRRGLSTKT